MTKQEFLDGLRSALSGQVHAGVIQEHIHYYDTYLSMQMKKGCSEEEALAALGDPRLIAKTIIEAEKYAAGRERPEAREREVRSGGRFRERFAGTFGRLHGRLSGHLSGRLPGWLWAVLLAAAFLLFLLLFSTVFSMLFALLGPILVPCLLIGWIVSVLRRFR